MTGKKLLILAGVIFVIELIMLISASFLSGRDVVLVPHILEFSGDKMALPDFEDVPRWNLDGTPEGESTFWSLNKETTIMIGLIDLLIITFAFLSTRALRDVPGRLQSVFEIIVEAFTELVTQTLGESGRRHIPMLGSLFLFLWISNIIGSIPFASEPTRDLNVPIGHMLVALFIVHREAIRVKGLKTYLVGYTEPFIVMMPLNIISEIASGVSLSFRLFGNILGGSIIVMVISFLTKYLLVPVGLNIFFGIFVGTIQAFVFTMLSMTYLAVAIAD